VQDSECSLVRDRHSTTLPHNQPLIGALSYLAMLFVTMIFVLATLQHSSQSCHCETFSIDRQWFWDHDIKFARWQHHAVGCLAQFAVCSSTCLVLSLVCIKRDNEPHSTHL